MSDQALSRIERLSPRRFDFGWLRSSFMTNDEDVWTSLDRGRAVLKEIEQLDQYLWTHGLMIQAQWRWIMDRLPKVECPVRLIDYGCGQGIAGLLLRDLTGGDALANVSDIILIEPSAVALARAQAVYHKICPEATISSFPRTFDNVEFTDIGGPVRGSTLHLLSNTLDIDDFDPIRLFESTLRPGRHTILAISQHREFERGTPRFRRTKAAFEHRELRLAFSIKRSIYEEFKCGDNGKWEAVGWLCEFEVQDG